MLGGRFGCYPQRGNTMSSSYDVRNIDWNQVWGQNTSFPYSAEEWDERVESFSEHVMHSNYASDFVNFLRPQAQWTVFDMGCGCGTLALPLAKLVKTVTAADFSPKMLSALEQSATDLNIYNISTLKLSWTDDWGILPPKSHDVAIASRSMLVKDFRGAIEKLITVTKRGIYLSLPVNTASGYDLAYQALTKNVRKTLDYSCCYNILYQMGIQANVTILRDYTLKIYCSDTEAIRQLTKRYEKDLNAGDMAALKKYINCQLVQDNNGWHLKKQQPYQCAVIWWDV